jgi:hypothetical protein
MGDRKSDRRQRRLRDGRYEWISWCALCGTSWWFWPRKHSCTLQVSSSGRTPYRAGTLRYQNRVVWRCGHRRHSLHGRSSTLECAAAALRRFQEGHIGLPHSLDQRLQPYDVRLLTNALGLDVPSPPTLAPSIRGALPLPIWKKIVFLHNSCCFYCGLHTYNLAQEHLVPVSLGGLTTPDNIAPACMKCNQRKAAMTVHEFFATTTRLEKQALLQKRREHEAQPLASLVAQMSLAVDRDHSKHS